MCVTVPEKSEPRECFKIIPTLLLGSIRPYLVAACKRYSEADAGPGAEAGPGFRDSRILFVQ